MSGVVYWPDPATTHRCRPGLGTGTAGPYMVDYPRGTVWECDCGRTWVSRGFIRPPARMVGRIEWRRESRWARRRRLKREVEPS